VGGGAVQAPAMLFQTADANGLVTVYGWGGNGVTGNQNADYELPKRLPNCGSS